MPIEMYGTKINDAKTPKINPPICVKLSMYGRVPNPVGKKMKLTERSVAQ